MVPLEVFGYIGLTIFLGLYRACWVIKIGYIRINRVT